MAGFGTLMRYWKHMRVPFQLTLAPLFLWGAVLGGARMDLALVPAFVSLHLFLYPGITAFNSAYDRDTGPVSGMLRPPEVPPHLLQFSILLQIAGALIAISVGLDFLAIYVVIALLAAGYSHPITRWKASPWGSAMVVALGQGVLGFLAGWCAASGPYPDATGPRLLLGAFVAGLTTLGFYPATQVFQVEEDQERGDRTLAVALGPVRALRLGSLCLGGAGAAAAWLMAKEFRAGDAALIAAAYGGMLAHNEMFARRIAGGLGIHGAYGWALRTSVLSTAGFLLFIALQTLR